jgi:hypothetical protein
MNNESETLTALCSNENPLDVLAQFGWNAGSALLWLIQWETVPRELADVACEKLTAALASSEDPAVVPALLASLDAMYWNEGWLDQFAAKVPKGASTDTVAEQDLLFVCALRLIEQAVKTEEAGSHVAEFMKFDNHANYDVKESIYRAMMFCPKGPGAARILQQLLIDPDLCGFHWKDKDQRSRHVLDVLDRVAPERTGHTVQFLIEALHHTNSTLRKAAVFSLGMIGPAARAAVPHMKKLMLDWDVRNEVRCALALIDSEVKREWDENL